MTHLPGVADPENMANDLDGLPVFFTQHAIQRLKESQLELKRAKKILLKEAVLEQIDRKLRQYKRNKYGKKQDQTKYYRAGPLLFTVIPNGKGFLVITVTDQRVMLPLGALI